MYRYLRWEILHERAYAPGRRDGDDGRARALAAAAAMDLAGLSRRRPAGEVAKDPLVSCHAARFERTSVLTVFRTSDTYDRVGAQSESMASSSRRCMRYGCNELAR